MTFCLLLPALSLAAPLLAQDAAINAPTAVVAPMGSNASETAVLEKLEILYQHNGKRIAEREERRAVFESDFKTIKEVGNAQGR